MPAWLSIAVGEGTPRVVNLGTVPRATLGRHRTNTIVLLDRHASRHHAQVYPESDGWLLRDCGTLNGTRLNGERIKGPVPLEDGHEIGIGDTRLRFSLERPAPKAGVANGKTAPPSPAPDVNQTALHTDELNALCSFMTESVEETTPRALLARALALVHRQTGASLTGFLSLDAEEPLPKMMLPEKAPFDADLSGQLTRTVQREGRLVWLGARSDLPQSDSLCSFRDALCVPLCAEGVALGALHVYKTGKLFSEREARFCEVLGGYLAKSLHVLQARRMLAAENSRLREQSPGGDDDLIGDGPAMQRVRQDLARVAPRPCIVLISGESGVGKELVALALHRLSPRCHGPLVTVNCGAITASLLEAELFGHCRGAFTGAESDRPGYFQQADEGTLFLDEIGELSPECQVKLLRVIEGKGFRPVGATAEVHADVRILAATHRDLQKMVAEGKFRQDLYFRLGVPLRVPPLRERREDVPALVEHILDRLSGQYRRSVRVTERALVRLQAYAWPGNVRQLRAVLEHALAMTDGDTLDVADLPLDEVGRTDAPLPSLNLQQLERQAIVEALRRTGGHIGEAADVLGIHRDTLSARMKKHGLARDDDPA